MKQKKNRITVLILLLAATLIWGSNIFRIITDYRVSYDKESIFLEEHTIDQKRDKYPVMLPPFDGSFRDPFKHHIRLVSKNTEATRQIHTNKPPIKPPEAYLAGIIEDIIMIRLYGDDIYFVSKHDSIGGMYISEISGDSVRILYKENEFYMTITE